MNSSIIKLKKSELLFLESYKSSNRSLREYNRANILLLLHKGKKIMDIEDFLNVDRITIWRTKKRYLDHGVKDALEEGARPGQPPKYVADHHAELAALACGPCPAFGKRKANRLLKKIRFIHTPKHGSWLNMAEIEINIMDRQCTGGRIDCKETLESNVAIWSKERNKERSKIEWQFTRQEADKKLSKHYVS